MSSRGADRASRNVKALSDKIQAGWTLTAQNCPQQDCITPLVRSKAGKVYCVNCELYVVSEQDVQKAAAVLDVTETPTSAPYKSLRALQEEEADSYQPEMDPPRMDADYEVVLSPKAEDRLRRLDEATKKLSTYMLKGWTLLGTNCPRDTCECPLVRNKERLMMCCQCSSWYVAEEDYDPHAHKDIILVDQTGQPVDPPQPRAQAPATPPPAMSSSSGARPAHVKEDQPVAAQAVDAQQSNELLQRYSRSADVEVDAPDAERKLSRAQGPPTPARDVPPAASAGPGGSSAVGSVLSSLVAKMEWAAQELNREQNLQRCQELAKLVKALADATKAVKLI